MRAFRIIAVLFAVFVLSLANVATAADPQIEVLWLGQSCFRIKTVTGKVIVIDPWLINNPKTPAAYKNLEALGKVDLILVTHAHSDHFADAPGLAKLNNAQVWGPAGLDQVMQTLGILPPELAPRMNKGGTIMPFGPAGVKITQVHAEHSSELVWKDPASGKDVTYPGGEPVGYIIEMENGFRIYHMGDSGLFGDMRLIGEHYKPDLLMIPIGGHFVLNPADAAFATREYIKPRFVIPMHYGTTPLLAGTPAQFIEALGKTDIKVMTMTPGDTLQF